MSECTRVRNITDHPTVGALMSSDTPNDMDPMKSFRVVRSQSHTSMDRRRSLSDAFSLLSTYTQSRRESNTVMSCLIFAWFNESMIKMSFKQTHTYKLCHLQGEGLIPARVERGTDGPGLLFGFILWIRDELEFNIWV